MAKRGLGDIGRNGDKGQNRGGNMLVIEYRRENGRIRKTKTEKPDRCARILKNSREKKWDCFSVYICYTPHQVHQEKITLKLTAN